VNANPHPSINKIHHNPPDILLATVEGAPAPAPTF